MNIIIPIGGLGERFKQENYSQPKPLIPVLGDKMIFHVIDNLNLAPDDQLICIYSKDLNKSDFEYIMRSKYKNMILIELHKQTEGAVETILIGIQSLVNSHSHLLSRKCVLLDCDTFYNTDILSMYRQQSPETNAVFCFKDNQTNPIYSYICFDPLSKEIHEIREKVKISEFANSGCYCFQNGHLLKTYCEKIIQENIREKNEYYTSCVIKEMMKDGHVFIANIIKYSDIVCIGTPLQLKIYCGEIHSSMIRPKRFCFDLDNTLVTAPSVSGDYSTVEPIQKNIDYVRFLKQLGHYIIIHTARRMKTHHANVGKIIKDVGAVTLQTLESLAIPYDEIYFGKPHADYYIDDLAINAYSDLEKETGYYKTSIEERDFNEIKSETIEIIVKKSNTAKLNGEIYYYLNIPQSLQHYFPRMIDFGKDWYSMDKIKGITLSYLYAHESFSLELFSKYLKMITEIHAFDFPADTSTDIDIYEVYASKIKERYANYDYSAFPESARLYNLFIQYFDKYKTEKWGKIGMIHGDPVFSNCILDKHQTFKLIDMRGMVGSKTTIYGDIFYDYAKIYQSLIGYDEILLGKIASNEYKQQRIELFRAHIADNYGVDAIEKIKMIANSLLFTLIPLHHNEKCARFYKLIDL